MKWKVVWCGSAEQQLTKLWLDSRMREAITNAAHELDAAVALDPEAVGESREEHERIVIFQPLAARIEIDRPSRTVKVLTVWQIKS